MKVAIISDLHGNLIPYPSDYWKGLEECEILLICGDISPLNIQWKSKECKKWFLEDFKTWAENLPVKKVYFIAGNHDYWLYSAKIEAKNTFVPYKKVVYLENECITHTSIQDYKNYSIFGTPYCHVFGNWPFMKPDNVLEELYNKIPNNVDILISHDPPQLGEIGKILQSDSRQYGKEAGNEVLAKVVLEKKPSYVFAGHIHSGEHTLTEIEGIKLANCSMLNEQYEITYLPLIVEV